MNASLRRVPLLVLLAAALGCDVPELPKGAPPAGGGGGAVTGVETDNSAATDDEAASVAAEAPPAPAVESRPVEATDPVKGRKSREAGGYLGAVGSARFTSEHSMSFNMVKKNLDLFEATNSRYPKSQEEFMQRVVVEGGVTLPELPEELEYYYDPEDPAAGLQVRPSQSE